MSVRGPDWKPELSDPEVQKYLFDEAGEDALEMAEYLGANNPISGVDVVEHFEDRKPSDVRKVLYRLMEAHAAEYEKSTDASGWETFIWNLDLPEIGLILRRRWADELLNLNKQIKFEEDHEFYTCDEKHRRMIFEDAMDIEFHCPVCEAPMQPTDKEAILAALRERVSEIAPAFSD